VLTHFMDARKVRVYIKDSLLKPYLRTRLENGAENILLAAGLNHDRVLVKSTYEKPHGRLFTDGKVICWGHSRDWKSIVISVFERAYQLDSGSSYAAVLVETGRTTNACAREMISELGCRLGLDRVIWVSASFGSDMVG